jgi:predicted phage-related endonuclease
MEEKELLQKITTLKALKQKKATLVADIQEIEKDIKNHMERNKLEEITISAYNIRYQTIYNNRFDVSTFKKEQLNLYKQYLTPSKAKRLTII